MSPGAFQDLELYYGDRSVSLYCGDSTVLSGRGLVFDTVVTDPPYGISFVNCWGTKGKTSEETPKSAPILADDSCSMMEWASGLLCRHSRYVFHRSGYAFSTTPDSVIPWIKPQGGMGNLAHTHCPNSMESIAFWQGTEHVWPAGRPPGFLMADVPRVIGVPTHPTMKPIGVMKTVISWTSGVIFDPFAGSGSTLVAAMGMGRRAIGIEIDKGYATLAADRLRQFRSSLDESLFQ